MKKILITIWTVFALGWSGLFIGIYMVGAGLSPADANISIGFFLYWLGPIIVPALIYWAVCKYKSSNAG